MLLGTLYVLMESFILSAQVNITLTMHIIQLKTEY